MITTNIHDASNVRLGPVQKLAGTNSFTRKFTFKSDENWIEITLFSVTETDLEVTQS